MKTQKKQLPELFYIQENEKTNEYCERLGLERTYIKEIDNYSSYIVFANKKQIMYHTKMNLVSMRSIYPDLVFVDLADYLDQEQPEPIGTIPASNSIITSVLSIGLDGSMDIKPIEQPEQKWQKRTRGGYEYHIYEEFEGEIFGRIKEANDEWIGLHWHSDGKFYENTNDVWDLIPCKNELTTLEKELEKVRSKEKEILEKIEELKTK